MVYIRKNDAFENGVLVIDYNYQWTTVNKFVKSIGLSRIFLKYFKNSSLNIEVDEQHKFNIFLVYSTKEEEKRELIFQMFEADGEMVKRYWPFIFNQASNKFFGEQISLNNVRKLTNLFSEIAYDLVEAVMCGNEISNITFSFDTKSCNDKCDDDRKANCAVDIPKNIKIIVDK